MAGKIALFLMIAGFVGLFGYSVGRLEKQNNMIECRIVRIVDGPEDNPVVQDRGQISRPYTVLAHNPEYSLFIVPGNVGMEDEKVWISPPN